MQRAWEKEEDKVSFLLPARVLCESPLNKCEACIYALCGRLHENISAEQFYLFSLLWHFVHLLFSCAGRVALQSSAAVSWKTALSHLCTLHRVPRCECRNASRIQRAAIVWVAIIQIRIGSDYTHTGINTLQSIDIIPADRKQSRGKRGGSGCPTQAQVFRKSHKLQGGTVCRCSALSLSVKGHPKVSVGRRVAVRTSTDFRHILTSSLERFWNLELKKVTKTLFNELPAEDA